MVNSPGMQIRFCSSKGVTCAPAYWSERDDWILAMVAAGLGFAPASAVKHAGVGLPIVEPDSGGT